jgi:hypothetical protein
MKRRATARQPLMLCELSAPRLIWINKARSRGRLVRDHFGIVEMARDLVEYEGMCFLIL